MGVLLAAIDGTLKCPTRRSRQAAEDEVLDLALAVVDNDRPALEFLDRDVAPDLGRAGLKERRRIADRHLLTDCAHLKVDVQRKILGDAQDDVLRRGRLEVWRRGSNGVRSG